MKQHQQFPGLLSRWGGICGPRRDLPPPPQKVGWKERARRAPSSDSSPSPWVYTLGMTCYEIVSCLENKETLDVSREQIIQG